MLKPGGKLILIECSKTGLLQLNKIRKKHPNISIIGFPRNAENSYLEYGKSLNVDCISLDQNINIEWLINNLKMTNNRNLCLQGNLAPEILLEGGEKMIASINNIIDVFSSINHIFNSLYCSFNKWWWCICNNLFYIIFVM